MPRRRTLPRPHPRRRTSPQHRASSMLPSRLHRRCAAPPPPRAISEILVPSSAPRVRARSRAAARYSARTRHAPERPRLDAVGAHRGLRKRDQRHQGEAERAGLVIELHRRRAPCGAGGRGPAARGQGTRRQGCRQGQRRQVVLEHHLENPLAAGRRQRGRDRARHLQDGDDPARHRHAAADAGNRTFERSARQHAVSRRQRCQTGRACADTPAPSMTSPTPIGKQSLNKAAPAETTASVAIPQTAASAAADIDFRQRHHRRDPERQEGRDGAGAAG